MEWPYSSRIKKVAPHMIAVHCMAHRLNLCSSKSADSSISEKCFPGNFEGLVPLLFQVYSKNH